MNSVTVWVTGTAGWLPQQWEWQSDWDAEDFRAAIGVEVDDCIGLHSSPDFEVSIYSISGTDRFYVELEIQDRSPPLIRFLCSSPFELFALCETMRGFCTQNGAWWTEYRRLCHVWHVEKDLAADRVPVSDTDCDICLQRT
jgi:hypothetical protein